METTAKERANEAIDWIVDNIDYIKSWKSMNMDAQIEELTGLAEKLYDAVYYFDYELDMLDDMTNYACVVEGWKAVYGADYTCAELKICEECGCTEDYCYCKGE